MNRRTLIIVSVIAALVAAGAGYWYVAKPRMGTAEKPDSAGASQAQSGRTVLYWYDPMTPGQKFDKPGKSPFMDMQLVPKYADEMTSGGVTIPAQVAQNLGIRLAQVASASFGDALTAVGRIEADEHRLYAVQTRLPGFVERLYVRAVGDAVGQNQKLADVYAPELLAAQQEYLALLKLDITDAETLRAAARTRLKLLGMAESEIAAIARSGQANPRFGVYAPASGFVTELGVRQGGQIMPGTTLMQLADLSTVWLIAEVPERDTGRLKPGETVEARLESLPGVTIAGRVSHLYPTLDAATRSVRVRIELPNRQGRLRPGMYASVALAGRVREALAVPTESVIATGTRKVVIVKDGDAFRPAAVETGLEREGKTEILKGLAAGENVVVSGQFLIDSEASLAGVLARLSSATSAPATLPVRGKVAEIDVKAGRITLAHEAIPALKWPAMTMEFKVRDPKTIGALKANDAVEFELSPQPEDGDYVIEHIAPQGATQ
ncbi:MAG: efflux RND transporter periplasmic adaptor subunit [Hydrogenophilales bacterium]|nr:efflux RND transporter periplasmic adaptor subunit [Hydrogenophilales bacterium]